MTELTITKTLALYESTNRCVIALEYYTYEDVIGSEYTRISHPVDVEFTCLDEPVMRNIKVHNIRKALEECTEITNKLNDDMAKLVTVEDPS